MTRIARTPGGGPHPELLVLDTVDVAPPGRLAALRTAYPDAVPVSALTGEGVEEEVRQAISERLDG